MGETVMDEDGTVIYVPRSRRECEHRQECSDLCRLRRWRVTAMTQDAETARQLVLRGKAHRVVVARPAHARKVALAIVVVTNPPRRPDPGDPGDDRPRRLS